MEIKIIKEKISLDELKKIASEGYGEMVKVVVDIESGITAIGAEFHSEEADVLFRQGSKNENLWGINIYPDKTRETWLEFNSLINIKPAFGNRSMDIENIGVKEKIKKIIDKIVI